MTLGNVYLTFQHNNHCVFFITHLTNSYLPCRKTTGRSPPQLASLSVDFEIS
jgi:hypothetical protein